jgi:hypothetical protein
MTKNKCPEKSAEKCPCPCHTNPTVLCCQDCALAHPATSSEIPNNSPKTEMKCEHKWIALDGLVQCVGCRRLKMNEPPAEPEIKHYVVVELIEEEGPLETEVNRRKVFHAKSREDAEDIFNNLSKT